MSIAELLTVLTNLGVGAAAWRLANALRYRVDNHEVRITKLETP